MTSKPKRQIGVEDKYAHIKPLPDPPKRPDAMRQFLPNSRTVLTLRYYFRDRQDILINGQGYLCHDTRDRSDWTVPDCVIAFGVDPRAIELRNGYVISEVGKQPDFVLEVSSESTRRRDIEAKRKIYEDCGISEYWRHDTTKGELYGAALAGDRLVNGVYQPVEITTDPDGTIWGHSPVLGVDLVWHAEKLRVFDPATGEYVPDPDEAYDRALAEAALRTDAEAEVRRLQEEIRRLRGE